MDRQLRSYFDRLLDEVVQQLPEYVHQLLGQVPLVVEDYPSKELLRRLRLRHRNQLCGLYTGVPLTQRSVEHSGVLSDVIHIFRRGIIVAASDKAGNLDENELRRQIRITVLHELGHHHGLGESELEQLGY
jgi:predicted Zn-dependent protease with MMP-like domain